MARLIFLFLFTWAVTLGSEGWGCCFLWLFRLERPRSFSITTCGLGLVWLTLILILAGLLHCYNTATMWGIFFVWIVAAGIQSALLYLHCPPSESFLKKEVEWLFLIFRLYLVVMLLLCFSTVMTPETRHDPYDYHLTIPALYLAQESIVEIPWHVFTYMPKNGEILYGLALGIDNDSFAKLIHYLFGLFCVFTLYSFGLRIGGKLMGFLMAVLAVTLPLFGFLATSAYVDLIRAFWELLAYYCLWCCWENREQVSETRKWILFSCLFAGMALGTKYVSWFVFYPPYGICLLFTLFLVRLGNRLTLIPFMVLLTSFPVIPWLTLNAVWTGNPIYPLLPSIFGMHIPPAREAYEFFLRHTPSADLSGVRNCLVYLITGVNV